MNDPAEIEIASAPLAPPGWLSRPLTIAHLLAITAGTAIAVTLLQQPRMPQTTAWAASAVFFAPFYGVAVAALAFALSDAAFRRTPILGQPGHALLVIVGGLFFGVTFLSRAVAIKPPDSLGALVALVVGLGLLVFVPVLALHGGSRNDWPWPWRIVFHQIWLNELLSLICCPVAIQLKSVVGWMFVGMALSIGAAVFGDVTVGERRNLWHWLGIAALLSAFFHAASLLN